MTFGIKLNDVHSSPKERQLQKTCVSFGEECIGRSLHTGFFLPFFYLQILVEISYFKMALLDFSLDAIQIAIDFKSYLWVCLKHVFCYKGRHRLMSNLSCGHNLYVFL